MTVINGDWIICSFLIVIFLCRAAFFVCWLILRKTADTRRVNRALAERVQSLDKGRTKNNEQFLAMRR